MTHFFRICIWFWMMSACVAFGADTVMLISGRQVEGDVTEHMNKVRVENETGTYTVAKSRVARIYRQDETEASSRRRADRVPVTPELRRGLQREISVSFEKTSLIDVMDYMRQQTDLDITYIPSHLKSLDPLSLQLEDTPVYRVLNSITEARELNWAVNGDIIRVRSEDLRRKTARVYRVRDLLLNVEDHHPPEPNSVSGLAAPGDGDDSSWGGSGWGNSGAADSGDDAGGRTPTQSLRSRAGDLARVITSTVRPGEWGDPAVEVIGGKPTD